LEEYELIRSPLLKLSLYEEWTYVNLMNLTTLLIEQNVSPKTHDYYNRKREVRGLNWEEDIMHCILPLHRICLHYTHLGVCWPKANSFHTNIQWHILT